MTGFVIAGVALLLALAVVAYDRWRTVRTMRRLDNMLTAAMNGSFSEKSFDESRLSALESRLARYLTASALSERNVREQKDQISALISDISHQTKTPVANLQLYPEAAWDSLVSNLALHYIEDLNAIFEKVHRTLKKDGIFLFNIEHPVFTAGVGQDWAYGKDGTPLYWPIDQYFMPGERITHFLGCEVRKQHHTLTQILMGLLHSGFVLEAVEEAEPSAEMLDIPGMRDELRRPMMLLVRARAVH